ncbi:MAG: LacI family DNA-binding transcriptional regulator [Bacteroidota bacterium]
MSITIYDIAKRARVSIATVSRVFNEHPRVSSETRQRVFRVADELGYEPHASAQSLARKNTQIVSAVVPMMTSFFFMEVLRGMQDRLDESDYDLLVYAARTLDRVDGQLARALQRGRSDGMLLASTPITPSRARRLANSRRPIVLVDSFHEDFDSVCIDNVRGGAEAVRHLLERGHERIGLILPMVQSVPAQDRLRGADEAMQEAGRTFDPRHIVHAEWDEEMDGYTRLAGYRAMKQLLDLPEADRPTAVFAAADVMALGTLRAAREAGLSIPGDLDLVGFDDIAPSAFVGLTTFRQPMVEMGKLATELLLRRMRDPDAEPSHTVFAPRLVVRETTGADAIALA